MKILGIESSCDETAAAVVEDGKRLLSSVVNSQVDIHAEFGGVVPEVAARSHIEVINPIIQKALSDADLTMADIDAIAVGNRPGLIGSLLVGTLAARTLAIVHDKPLYPVHHVEAHVYANFITENGPNMDLALPAKSPRFPFLALAVSGLHSQLLMFYDHGDYELIGQTQDDAIGEAFDKVARILGLGYPGGPAIARAAESGDAHKYQLPKAKLKTSPYDYSFSGLKTAVLRAVQREVGQDFTFPSHQLPELLSDAQKADFAASFQRVAIETLVDKAELAYQQYQPASVVIAGGVAANQLLRHELAQRLSIDIDYAPIELCTDNAAMIASLGYFHASQTSPSDPYKVEALPSQPMTESIWK